MNFCITTDSGADLPLSYCQTHDITVLPLAFTIEGQTYHGSGAMDDKVFYDKLRAGALPTTSAANPEDTAALFRTFAGQGKDLLHVAFSSGLSSTSDAAQIAAQMVMEEYPQRKIIVVDSLCASMGQGLLVWLTVQELKHGATLEEAAKYAEDNRLHLCHWFTVDDLFFLKRGGRVSAATALVGSALGIKPVLHVDNEGHLINVSKARGRKNSILALVDRMERSAIEPEKQTVFISHGDCLADAEFLAQEVRRRLHVPRIEINYVGPVIGAHSGPGTLALFFLGTAR